MMIKEKIEVLGVIVHMDFPINIIASITGIVAWSVIGILAYRIYKKQIVKPKVWKVLIVIFVGLFSFSINWYMFNTMVKLPILPLGVWILYWFFRKKAEQWQTYRTFAWLGFFMNFIFLVSTLVITLVHYVVYPKNEFSTYISAVENAAIIQIHPSAKDRSLNNEHLLKQLQTMRQETIYSEQWYGETYMNAESNQINERFPYQLIGTLPKFGSGIHTIVYVEADGKGMLISTPKNQVYFRSEDSLLKGGK